MAASSAARGGHSGSIVSGVDVSVGSRRTLSGRRRRSVDSIPALVIHPPPSGSTPPRPPRSPKRNRLPDIREEGSTSPRSDRLDPALEELESLRNAVQAFARRLQAIRPPVSESSAGSRTSSSPTSTTERLRRRTRSMSSVEDTDEQDGGRTASGGTFGPDLIFGSGHGQQLSTSTLEYQIEDEMQSLAVVRPTTPLLPPLTGHSPISPLALASLPVSQGPRGSTPRDTADPLPSAQTNAHTSPPTLHVTRPSTSDNDTEPQAFATVVDMMQRGKAPALRQSRESSPTDSAFTNSAAIKADPAKEGRTQTPRRGFTGPKSMITKVKSSSSLNKVKDIMANQEIPGRNPSVFAASKISSTKTTFLRPAPLPPLPSSFPARFAHTDYPRSNASSPSPSAGPGSVFARASPNRIASPMRSTRNGLEGQAGEMVEIPRFNRKELNLSLVRKRGPGQRIAWILLWAIWLVNGLVGLFFDVNLMYILVQCTKHSARGNGGPSRSWAFATAAYAICWGISVFAVWLGWEVYYEFWRKWRQERPAIEPIYTSLPASLHLSLWSYSHFTFLVYIRSSSYTTPFRADIVPETAYALVQLLPGLLPLLPRAGIGIVLLTTFSSLATRTDKDEQFFTSLGNLTEYARGVVFAFVAVVALRAVVFLIAAVTLLFTSTRKSPFIARGSIGETPSTPKRNAKSSTQPRDPATTRSPQKTWYEAETSFGWETWRSRMRSRIQDTYELCMIRRGGTGIGMMVDGSYLVVGAANPGSRVEPGMRLVERATSTAGRGSIEELTDEGHMMSEKRLSEGVVDKLFGTPTTGSTMLKLSQARPHNPAPSSSQTYSLPSDQDLSSQGKAGPTVPHRTNSQRSNALYAPSSQASQSSHDVFYTPAQGNTPQVGMTPTTERTGMNLGAVSQSTIGGAPIALRSLSDPSRATLPARPESDALGEQPRVSQDSGTEESITDDSAALLSSSSSGRESSAATVGSESLTRGRSQSIISASQGGSRPTSRDRGASGILGRSRTGSLSSVGQTLKRARSSSINILRGGSGTVQGAVRRVRSGTVGDVNGYNRVSDDDGTPHTLPRRRSKLGLGVNPVGGNVSSESIVGK